MNNKKTLPVGSLVDYASLRTQDLIPAFLDLLSALDAPEYEAYVVAPFGAYPSCADDDDDHAYWYSDDAMYLLEELIDTLGEYCPDDHYFGAHPGNGSDFGCWEIKQC